MRIDTRQDGCYNVEEVIHCPFDGSLFTLRFCKCRDFELKLKKVNTLAIFF